MRGRDGRSAGEREGRELGIIGIDNPHNVSVSRMNAHFPICVVSPRERGGSLKNAEVTKPGRACSLGLPQSLYSPHCQFQSATYGVRQ